MAKKAAASHTTFPAAPSCPDRTAWTIVSAALPMTKGPAMPANATATEDAPTIA